MIWGLRYSLVYHLTQACRGFTKYGGVPTYASLAEEHNILQTEELSQCTPSVPNPGIQMVPEKWSESHSHLFVVVLIPALAALARGQTWRDFCFSRERKN